MGLTSSTPKQRPDMRAVHKNLSGCSELLTKRETHLQDQINTKEETLRQLAAQSKDPHVRARCRALLRERRMLMAAHQNTQAKRGHADELKLIVEEVDVNKTYLETMDSVAASFRGQGIGALLDATSKNMQELGDSVADLDALAAELRTPLGTANITDEDLEEELRLFFGEEAPGAVAQGGDNGSASSPGILSAEASASVSALSATKPAALPKLPSAPTMPVSALSALPAAPKVAVAPSAAPPRLAAPKVAVAAGGGTAMMQRREAQSAAGAATPVLGGDG